MTEIETNSANTASTQTETVKVGVLQLPSHPALGDAIYKGSPRRIEERRIRSW